MMRILLLAPVHRELELLRRKTLFPIGQGQKSWVEALKRLGHQVFVFRYTDSVLVPNPARIWVSYLLNWAFPRLKAKLERFSSRYYYLLAENWLKNRRVVDLSQKVQPDLILISGGASFLFVRTIAQIKDEQGCKVLLLSGINPKTSTLESEKVMVREGTIDLVVDNDRGYAKQWERIGAQRTIVLPISAVDPLLHRKHKLSKREEMMYGSDVCFVGTLTRNRQRILERLTDFKLSVWGDVQPTVGLSEKLKPFYQGAAYGEKMVKIFNTAKIVLNFQPPDMTHGGNMRSFEIPGCGAFQLVDRIDTAWFIKGKEVVVFNTIDDLRKKIRYYLHHEEQRKKIAQAGYRKAHRSHTYDVHFKKLLQLTHEKN